MDRGPMITGSGTQAPPRRKIFYGWYIVGAGSVSTFFNSMIITQGLSAFIPALRDNMGWSVAAISFGFSLRAFEQGLLGPVAGYMIDRFGPRLMCTLGVSVMTLGLVLFSQSYSLWSFYLSAMVIALGQGLGANQSYSAAMVHWFRKKRGRANAFLQTGIGLGYVGVYPITLVMALVGWQSTALFLAIMFGIICIPLAQLIRHRPQPYGFLPDGDLAPATEEPPSDAHDRRGKKDGSFTVKEALKSRPFWMVLIARALYGLTQGVFHIHQIPHLMNRGYSAPGAGAFVAVYGLVQIFNRLVAGFLGDRVGRVRLFRFSFLFLGVGWWFFAVVSPGSLVVSSLLFFVTFGVGHAMHAAAGNAVLADFFGPERYATITGLMQPMTLLISVIGPLYGGFMYDFFGSYQYAFMIFGPIIALGTVAMLFAGNPTLSGQEVGARGSGGH